jgi:hypothetical protein
VLERSRLFVAAENVFMLGRIPDSIRSVLSSAIQYMQFRRSSVSLI